MSDTKLYIKFIFDDSKLADMSLSKAEAKEMLLMLILEHRWKKNDDYYITNDNHVGVICTLLLISKKLKWLRSSLKEIEILRVEEKCYALEALYL